MSLYVQPRRAIVDSVNTLNATTLTPADIVYGVPQVASQDVQTTTGKNTTIRLTGSGTTWSGTVVVNYNRLDLSDLLVLVGDTIAVADVTTTLDLVKFFNHHYGMVLVPEDFISDPIVLDENGEGTATIRASSTSMGWLNQVTFNLVKGDQLIESAVTTVGLTGINYPSGQSATGQAALMLYGYDFTANYDKMHQVAVGTTLGSTVSEFRTWFIPMLTAADSSFTGNNAWMSEASAATLYPRNLNFSRVIYNGLNSPEFSTNQAYKYVMMLQPADGVGGNGVAASPKHFHAGIGVIVLHYNEPVDLN